MDATLNVLHTTSKPLIQNDKTSFKAVNILVQTDYERRLKFSGLGNTEDEVCHLDYSIDFDR